MSHSEKSEQQLKLKKKQKRNSTSNFTSYPEQEIDQNPFGVLPESLSPAGVFVSRKAETSPELSRNHVPLVPLSVVRPTPARSTLPSPSTAALSVLSKPPVSTRKEIQKSADDATRQQTIREWKDGIGKALCFIGGGMIIGGFTHLNAGLIAFGIIFALVGLALIHKAAKEKAAQEKSASSLFPRVEIVEDEKAVQPSSIISNRSPVPVR
ncbi:MAG TPA: hypothetical protein VGV92_09610 [Gammaproteobacteria bacterium]|nr:hypothetical protein [Gammaproteobacteria bacterium]